MNYHPPRTRWLTKWLEKKFDTPIGRKVSKVLAWALWLLILAALIRWAVVSWWPGAG